MAIQTITDRRLYKSAANATVLVTGLGFFVDSYDFFLYNAMRVSALTDLGLSGEELTRTGITILNLQIIGALFGSVIFGIIGDRLGRRMGLVWSILTYSVGMFLTGLAPSTTVLALGRLLTGFGAAGEIGVGATLVAETVNPKQRTLALAFFTFMGTLGVTVAALSLEFASWRTCCFVGAAAGASLLLMRMRLFESSYFLECSSVGMKRGSVRELFLYWHNLKILAACTAILVPNFFVTALLLTFSPEVARALGVVEPVKANIALASYFAVSAFGDLCGAALSNLLSSRRKVAGAFIVLNVALGLVILSLHQPTPIVFYLFCASLGLCNLWAISGTIAVEHFPTHIRSLASSTTYNLARGSVVAMNLMMLALKPLGTVPSLVILALSVGILGLLGVRAVHETYGRELGEEITIGQERKRATSLATNH